MNIKIVIALDENYWQKAKEYALFDSIEKNTKGNKNVFVKCLCFGFDVPESDKHFKNDNWDWARCEINELKSFRSGWPSAQKNRKFYVCAEGGEFLDYFDFEDSDLIIHIDADTTMQRGFSKQELKTLQSIPHGQIASCFHAEPTISLEKELDALILSEPKSNIIKHFPRHWDKPVFCAGLIVCTAKTYRDTIYKHYLSNVDKMTMLFNHHAAGQWLMNYIAYEYADFVELPRTFGHADWYIGADKTNIKDNKLMYGKSVVLFNHNKFNRIWDF